jgi:hypothetical protein
MTSRSDIIQAELQIVCPLADSCTHLCRGTGEMTLSRDGFRSKRRTSSPLPRLLGEGPGKRESRQMLNARRGESASRGA